MTTFAFRPATKVEQKARIALVGGAGTGKTYTALEIATALGSNVALIDTEHGKASMYAQRFAFSTVTLEAPYHPERLVEAARSAVAAGFDVLVADSMSLFWTGTGGVTELADKFGDWGKAKPLHHKCMDALLSLPIHVIATMRARTEYVVEKDDRGKQLVREVGLGPVQEKETPYLFDVIGYLDQSHVLTITKSRIDGLSEQIVAPGDATRVAKEMLAFLEDGEPRITSAEAAELSALFDAVDEADRTTAKQTFVDRFGKPDQVLASRLDEAHDWVFGEGWK